MLAGDLFACHLSLVECICVWVFCVSYVRFEVWFSVVFADFDGCGCYGVVVMGCLFCVGLLDSASDLWLFKG